YLLSHMIVMPLIALFAAACEVPPREASWTPGLLPLLALSLANGCVLEIGRKTWSPECEREGVETYSALWGYRRTAIVWLACVVAAAALTLWVGLVAGAIPPVLAVLAAPVVLCFLVARSFMRSPTKAWQKRFEIASGLWVLVSYLIIGLAPAATGWL
ncbi:MAG: manganese transporter permease, partial [Alphaproteobacteria bacterium]|nr:manganese transporter permease [Alphaproteobacteria bacterium]